MCGICGFTGSPPDGALDAMLLRLRHRGPDDEGRFVASEASLGARRLAIVDVVHGHQPTANEDQTVIGVLNGEIYNHGPLRRMLTDRGHHFRSGTDTEILPHLYEEFGSAFLPLLRGMFTIAIWDRERASLLLARDRMGEKPLFLAELANGGIAFGSELRCLLAHPGVRATLDPGCVAAYLTLGYVPGPRTMIAGVRRLSPGHVYVWADGRLDGRPYWEPQTSARTYGISPSGAPAQLRALLESAVGQQLEADVPVGALLSGGIDSAAIVALMGRVGSARPLTFTVGFAEAAFDERNAAARVARHVGTEHTEIVVHQPDPDVLRAIVHSVDEPIGDQAVLPTFLIAREARRHVTVVLSGEGSDELFAGYPRYRWFDRATRGDAAPESVRRVAVHVLDRLRGGSRRGQIDLLLGPGGWLERYLDWIAIFPPSLVAAVLRPEHLYGEAGLDVGSHLESLAERWTDASPVERTMLLDLRTWLVDDLLVKADRMSMAVSLEARAPYLDHRVVDFATSLPPRMRIGRHGTKWMLREAVADLLPAETLARPKRAFGVPVAAWLGQGLTPVLRDVLLASDSRTADFLRPGAVDRLLADTGRDPGRRVWALGILELWLRSLEELA